MGSKSRGVTGLVIGGCGFIGLHLVQGLLAEGFTVRVLDAQGRCEVEDVVMIRGDFCNRVELNNALDGVDIVFQCVSMCSRDGSIRLVERVNITGTVGLIAACNRAGVKKLVLISSCSVVSELGKHTRNGRECQPYAKRPFDQSFQTKILQEQIVLTANSLSLMTASVRIFAAFGPHPMDSDLQHSMFPLGHPKYDIGSGKNKIDFTYIANIVHGVILTADHLFPSSPVCGQAYNITNGEPVSYNWLLSAVVQELNREIPRKRMPFWLMLGFAFLLNILYSILSVCQLNFRTNLTLPSVNVAGKDSYYSIDKARAQLGYRPIFSVQEGLDITLARVREQRHREIFTARY